MIRRRLDMTINQLQKGKGKRPLPFFIAFTQKRNYATIILHLVDGNGTLLRIWFGCVNPLSGGGVDESSESSS